jgi:hypothetical protein
MKSGDYTHCEIGDRGESARSGVVLRLRRRRARSITAHPIRPIPQKAFDSFSHCLNKLRLGNVGSTIAAPQAIETVTAVEFSENRLGKRLAIDEGLAMRTLQPGQRLLLFWVHMTLHFLEEREMQPQ